MIFRKALPHLGLYMDWSSAVYSRGRSIVFRCDCGSQGVESVCMCVCGGGGLVMSEAGFVWSW